MCGEDMSPGGLSNNSPAKTYCEFFAGIGLIREALYRSGWRSVYANDIDLKKRQIYCAHFGDDPGYHLADVAETEEVVGRITEDPFLATASFPCVDMSLAGRRRGFRGGESSALFAFFAVVESLGLRQPRMLLLENVTGFLTANDGDDFRSAARAMADLGYYADSFVLDARLFTPQSRPRLFLIGYHESLAWSALAVRSPNELGLWDEYIARVPALRPPRLRSIIDSTELATGWATIAIEEPNASSVDLTDVIDLDDDQEWWDESGTRKHYDLLNHSHRDRIDRMIHADRPTPLTAFRRIRQSTQRLEVRFDGKAGCLRTPRGGSARQIVVAVGGGSLRMRWMSPREYARLQGVGGYRIEGFSITQLLFGFGDAVCVPVIEWIDRNLLTPAFEETLAETEVRHGD
jgi:DNA (cytosine-5)-methyltransferase 1